MTSFTRVPHTGDVIRFGARQCERAERMMWRWPRWKYRAFLNWIAFLPQMAEAMAEQAARAKKIAQPLPRKSRFPEGPLQREGSYLCGCGARISANKETCLACSGRAA